MDIQQQTTGRAVPLLSPGPQAPRCGSRMGLHGRKRLYKLQCQAGSSRQHGGMASLFGHSGSPCCSHCIGHSVSSLINTSSTELNWARGTSSGVHGAPDGICMGSQAHSCGSMLPFSIRLKKRLNHAEDHSTMSKTPDPECAAQVMHWAPSSQAAKAALEAPSGSQLGSGHTNTIQ